MVINIPWIVLKKIEKYSKRLSYWSNSTISIQHNLIKYKFKRSSFFNKFSLDPFEAYHSVWCHVPNKPIAPCGAV